MFLQVILGQWRKPALSTVEEKKTESFEPEEQPGEDVQQRAADKLAAVGEAPPLPKPNDQGLNLPPNPFAPVQFNVPEMQVKQLEQKLNGQVSADKIRAAMQELNMGQLGPGLLNAYREAARNGVQKEFHQALLKEAKQIPGMTVEDLSSQGGKAETIKLRLKPDGQNFSQTTEINLRTNEISQRMIQDDLPFDPLTNSLLAPDQRSTAKKAEDAGVQLPEAFSSKQLEKFPLAVPDLQNPAKNPGGKAMTLGEFARGAGLKHHQLNDYYQAVFFSTNDPKLREQAIQGLRDEVLSNKNPSALAVLQDITAKKAAIELKEAEKAGDKNAQVRALTQLASLEQVSGLAADILRGTENGKPSKDKAPHPLSEEARKNAKDLAKATFQQADNAYGAFLSRNLEKLPPGERQGARQNAIKNLEFASEQRLNLMARDDFNHTKRSFQSIDALMTIKETGRPEEAAKQLGTMHDLVRDHQDSSASGYLQEIERSIAKKGYANIDQLKADLEGGGAKAQKALLTLKESTPDLKDTMNNFRLDRIMRGLNSDASSLDMEKASTELKEELRHGNDGAGPLLDWTRTGESSLKIQEALKSRRLDDPQSVKNTALVLNQEMNKLAKLSAEGNGPARAALLGMLMEGPESQEKNDWRFFQDKPPLVPDLSKLEAGELALVKAKAAESLADTLSKNPDKPLSKDDTTALAVALSDAYKNNDKKLQESIENLFKISLKGKGRSDAIDGLLRGMDAEHPGSEKLSKLYVEAAKDGGVSPTQRHNLALLGRYGNEGALRALSDIASGAINPNEASWAARDLQDAGKSEQHRDKALAVMLETYEKKADNGSLIKAIGAVAALDDPANSKAQTTVREAFEKSAASPNSEAQKSARQGFLAMAPRFDAKDIEVLSKNLVKPEIMKELPGLVDKIPETERSQLINLQHDLLVKGNPQERIAAVQAFAALSRHLASEQANDLSFLTSQRGRDELKRAGMDEGQVKEFMEASAKTLMSMMGSADRKVQDAAYDAFRRKQDWPGLLGDEKLRAKIIDYVQGRPTDLELNKEAMALIYDAGIARPLAGVFKDLGVKGSSDELFKLADKASKNYTTADLDGKELIRQVLANAAAINSMPEDMREKLTGSKASIDMAQLVGQLANGTIDAKTPPNNPLFSDLKSKIYQEQSRHQTDISALERKQKAQEELLGRSLKWLGEHTKDQSIGLGKRFADTFMGTDYIGNFEENQAMNVRRVERINKEMAETSGKLAQQKIEQAYWNLSEQARKQFELSLTNTKAADQMLMSMLAAQGPGVLAKFAPSSFAQIDGAMERLKLNKLGQESKLPDYSGKDGFQEALKGLAKLSQRTERGWASDYEALKTTAFQAIDGKLTKDGDKGVFSGIKNGAAEINSRLPILYEMFNSGRQGSRYEEFVKTARHHANEIKAALDAVSPEELREVRQALKEMKDALKDVKDVQAAKELDARIKAYEGALDLFDGKKGGQVRSILNEIINKDSFDETTFANWALKEGPVIAASLVAAAAVIALTAGAATPVVVAGLILAPAAALTAGELTKEGLYHAGVRKEGALLGDQIRGREIYDPKTGKMRQLDGADVFSQYGKQYLTDLAITLGTLGAGTLLAKGISHMGQATFGKLLMERGAAIADLSRGLTRAEIAAAQAGNKSFVKEFFKQLQIQSSFASKQAIGEDLLHPLMKGEYDKYVPLLVTMALITAHGVSFRPQGKHIEFDLKASDLGKAPDLLTKQMLQFHNDGMTVRPLKGGAFEVISPKTGEVTEYRPSKSVGEHLKNFQAPDWVTNGKPIITSPNLGELGRSIGPRANTAPERLAAQVEEGRHETKANGGKRQRDTYKPEIADPTEAILKALPENLPGMSGKPVVEFNERMSALKERWAEDHRAKQTRLERLEPELRDAEMALEKQRAAHMDSAIEQAQAELSKGDRSWYRKPFDERQNAIEKRANEKLAALEKTAEHPLAKAKAEYERLASEKAGLTREVSELLETRKAELQKEFDYMHEKHGWPKVSLKVGENMIGSAGGYRFGTGELFIPKDTFLAAKGKGAVELTAFHEMVHAVQDRLIGEYALKKAGGDLARAKELYEGMANRPAELNFLAEIKKNPAVKEWTPALEQRAKDLASRINEGLDVGTESVRLGKHAQFIEGRLHSLKRDKNGKAIDNLFEHFESKTHGQEFQRGLFPNGMPAEVEAAYKNWQKAKEKGESFDREGARKAVAEALESELGRVNKEHKALIDKYANNPLEVEAYAAESNQHYGAIIADAARAASPSTRTPSAPVTIEAARMQLTAKAAFKGDSLHSESRGHEALRKLYESKLADGSIKPAELKKLLELPGEDRGAIESMLGKNKLSPEAFAKLMELEPRQIGELLNNPPKIFNEILMPALERGLVDGQKLSQILSMPESQRRLALDFIEKSVKDPSGEIKPESISRFLELDQGQQSQISSVFAQKGQTGVRALSAAEINSVLQVPTRQGSGAQSISDAPALARGLAKGIISPEQVRQFASMDDAARSGFAGLLRSDALSRQTADKLLNMVKAGEVSGADLQSLNMGKLRGWLSETSIESLLKQETNIRQNLLKSLEGELSKGRDGQLDFQKSLDKAVKINELVKNGTINETTARSLAQEHAHDTILNELISSQAKKLQADRMNPENIAKLVELAGKGEIDPMALEAYRSNFESGKLSNKTLTQMLEQSAEQRKASEIYMMAEPAKFAELAASGRFAEISSRLPELTLAAQKEFADMFPEKGKFEFEANGKIARETTLGEITEFMSRMNKGDYKGALSLVESKTVTAEQKTNLSTEPEIRWVEKKISLADLNSPSALAEMHSFMKSQGTAKGTQLDRYNPNSIESKIKLADPVIELPGGKQFRLRNSESIYENGNWRRSTVQEKALIESIQNSPAGKAMIGKTAMILMEEFGHTKQGGTGGLSSITSEFASSPEAARMRSKFEESGLKGEALEARVNEALREIDIAAAVKEAGMSTKGLQKLFGDQHLRGEREYLYQFLERKEAARQGRQAQGPVADAVPKTDTSAKTGVANSNPNPNPIPNPNPTLPPAKPQAPSGLRPQLEKTSGKGQADEASKLSERASKVSGEAAKLAGLDKIIAEGKLASADGQAKLHLAEVISGIEKLPPALAADMKSFLEMGANGPKAGRLPLAEHLLKVNKEQGADSAKILLDGMRKVCCEMEAERAKRPRIPEMKEIFTPGELAQIEAVAKAQAELPKLDKLPPDQHAKMVDDFYKLFASEVPGGKPAQEKVMHIVIGPPGAGKTSSLVEPLSRDALVIDSDRIKPSLPGYTADFQGKPELGLGTNAVHHPSSLIANDILQKAMANGDNIVYPILGRVPESLIDITMRAKAQGYKVALHIADVPPEVAARRVFNRAGQPPDANGVKQMVPPDYATKVAKYDPQIVFDSLIKNMPQLFDAWSHANTNVPRGQAPIITRSQKQIEKPK